MKLRKLEQKRMGRNNEKNIKKHNDKLHKAQAKAKSAQVTRREKLSAITKKYNQNNPENGKQTTDEQI